MAPILTSMADELGREAGGHPQDKLSCPPVVKRLPGNGINVRPQDLPTVCLLSLSPFLTFPSVLFQIFQFSSFQALDQLAKPFTTASLYMFSLGHLSLQGCPPRKCLFIAVPSSHPLGWDYNTA